MFPVENLLFRPGGSRAAAARILSDQQDGGRQGTVNFVNFDKDSDNELAENDDRMATVNFVNFARLFPFEGQAAGKASACVADDLELDSVMVEEIEAAAGLIVAMAEGHEPGLDHFPLGRVEILDLHSDMVERLAFLEPPPRWRILLGIKGKIMIVRPDMDDFAVVPRRALPSPVPAEDIFHQARGALGIADREIDMLDSQ
jgi:hypothetical protein